MLEQRPVSGSVRHMIDFLLRTDADFDAFCLDCIPTVYRRFGKGMERTEKVNLLLSLEDSAVVATRLRAWSLKQQPHTSNQSWRWLIVALLLLGGLTVWALHTAVSRLGTDERQSAAVTLPVLTTSTESIPRRAQGEVSSIVPAASASSTNSGNAIADSFDAQMKNRATGAAKAPGLVNSGNHIEGSPGATMTNEVN